MTKNDDWKTEFLAKQAAIKARAAAINASYGHGSSEPRKPVSPEARAASVRAMAADAFRKMGRR